MTRRSLLLTAALAVLFAPGTSAQTSSHPALDGKAAGANHFFALTKEK